MPLDSKNILSLFPGVAELKKSFRNIEMPLFRKANGHIHTPYSFSAFRDMDEAFRMAVNENIATLGINDFFVTDGYQSFNEGCIKNSVFPLFNIEFIGLMKEEQKKGIRINDPNNPGRIYFCGKGVDYPFHLSSWNRDTLERVKRETQNQLRAMSVRLNDVISSVNPSLSIGFDEIKREFAKELVRERHLAKAVRVLAEQNYSGPDDRRSFYHSLFGKSAARSDMNDNATLENEIRSKLLKAGGRAFVEEDEKSFLGIAKIIEIITDAGGIPCYPVLLDDPDGKCTEFETNPAKLYKTLSERGIGCIELIPGRNDHGVLEKFVDYFYRKGFIITFGTEHNAPDMIPLTVSARGGRELSTNLMKTGWNGLCVIAAHQYFRARGEKGFTEADGKARIAERASFEKTGRLVIEHFLRNKSK